MSIESESKHSKRKRFEISPKWNPTRHVLKSFKTLKQKQIVQSKSSIPLQSIVSSVEESASSSRVNPNVKIVEIEIFAIQRTDY